MGNSTVLTNIPKPHPPVNALTPRAEGVILHEYRHDSNDCNHQLVMKVTLDGFELVCPRCRSENKNNSRVLVTWTEVLTMMLMAMRMRG